jgi:hypothetical protein
VTGRTPRRLLTGALVLTLLAGVGTLVLRRLDRTRPVTVDEAVDRFRSQSPSPPGPSGPSGAASTPTAAPGSATPGATPTGSTGPGAGPGMTGTTRLPGATAAPGDRRTPEGVYVYATTGHETADAGVPTARHDYPAQTTMTVTHGGGCGAHVRWDATADRWDDVADCVSANASRITAYTSFHRFFGQSERRDYTCSGTSYLRPPSTKPGYRWAFDCVTKGAKAHTEAVLVGTERVAAGDGTVDALHVKFDTTLTGSSKGTNPSEFWLVVDQPFVVRQAGRVDADVTTEFGTIRYHEEYDLRLTSRTPRR